MTSTQEYIAKPSKAPLQEIIFELHWELAIDENSNEQYDEGFELAQGIFAETIKKDFPFYKRIVSPLIPLQLVTGKPVHQFWKSEKLWPISGYHTKAGPSNRRENAFLSRVG